MPTAAFSIRFVGFIVLIGGLLGGPVGQASAQGTLGEGQGTATLEDWPRSLPTLLEDMGERAPYLLPKIDSLALDYRYEATDTTSRWTFALSWRPGRHVLHRGDIVPWKEGPSDIRMANVELRADVWLDGESVAEMIVAVDSMSLGPLPGRFRFTVRVDHDRVFLDTSPEEARRLLSQGVALESIVVERMGFTSAESRRTSDRGDEVRRERSASSSFPRVYESQTRLAFGWHLNPRPAYVSNRRADKDARPRRETVGQSSGSDDSQRRGGGRNGDENSDTDDAEDERSTSKESDDEEEEETSLRMPALGAVAAVALIGYAAGSVGLYGRGDTPIGMGAGWTDSSGGIQFHAAVNRAVLEGRPGQKLTTKALGFYDVFEARVQPAVGLGLQIDPQRTASLRPSVSFGLVGNFNPVVLYGGVDVIQQTPELGIMYNFRFGRGQEEETVEDSP